MKIKTGMVIAILCIIFNNSNAQLIHSYGLKVGIARANQIWNFSGIAHGAKAYDQSRIGLNIGGYVEWFNIPFVSVITEANYIQKGAKEEYEVTTVEYPAGTGEMRTLLPRIDYLSIPVLAKIRYETPIISLYGLAGPRLDYLVGNNQEASGAVFNEFKSSEYGFTFGVGIDLPVMSYYKIGGEVRRSYSSQNAYSNQNLTVKNNSMEFLLTIGF